MRDKKPHNRKYILVRESMINFMKDTDQHMNIQALPDFNNSNSKELKYQLVADEKIDKEYYNGYAVTYDDLTDEDGNIKDRFKIYGNEIVIVDSERL